MEIAYLHVVINHLPIMGVPIALGVFLLGVWARSDAIRHAALLAFFLIGMATVAVFLTGQGGEDFIEHVAGVSEEAIEAHEEIATVAFASTGFLGVLSLVLFLGYGGVSLLRRRAVPAATALPAVAIGVVIVVAVATTALLGYTGRLGGKITHAEFATQSQAMPASVEDAEAAAKAAEEAEEESAEAAEDAEDDRADAARKAERRSGRGRGRGGRG